jgi:predicted ATP-dependent endonuclease of OLD family
MKYQKFNIENYKGINKVELDLANNRVITLVGLNESGKTTIMEAINLLYGMIKGNELAEIDLNKLRPKGTDFTGSIKISGTLVFEEEDKDKISEYWKSLGKNTRLEIPAEFSYTYEFPFNLAKYQIDKARRFCDFPVKTTKAKRTLHELDGHSWRKLILFIKTDIVPEILYYDDFIFDIPSRIQFTRAGALFPENMFIDKNLNDKWQPVLDDILKSTNPNLTSFKENVVDIWDLDNELARQRIEVMNGKLNQIITKRWKELFCNDKNKELSFQRIVLTCTPQGDSYNVSFEIITANYRNFNIDERSKGCKWFFSFLLFTEFRKNRTKNILFLLDEPASNLHSSAQTKIIDALDQLSKDSLVIYATHSHHLINIKWLSGAYIVMNETLEESLNCDMTFNDKISITAKKYYTFIGDGQGNDKISYFQPILDALDYAPSTIEPVPELVILEGKNDWYTFKYFQDVILQSSEKYNFYPGAGVDKLSDIIRLYLSWGKKFIVIIDGDKPGKDAKKRYEKDFGEILKNKIFTLDDVLSNRHNIQTESLIEESDKNIISEKIFGQKSTGKSTLNWGINQALAQKIKIELSEVTKNTFRTVFDFIKEKLV